jgi:hypothetical protein
LINPDTLGRLTATGGPISNACILDGGSKINLISPLFAKELKEEQNNNEMHSEMQRRKTDTLVILMASGL